MAHRKDVVITRKQLITLWAVLIAVLGVAFWLGVKFGNSTCSCPETVINPSAQTAMEQQESTNLQQDTYQEKDAPQETNSQQQAKMKTVKKEKPHQEEPTNKPKATKQAPSKQMMAEENQSKKAEQTPQPKTQPNIQPKIAKKTDAKFTIQLSAFLKRDQAESFVKNFTKKHGSPGGVTPYIVEATAAGKHVYRVRIGKFSTREKAKAFQQEHNLTGMVYPIK